MRILLVEDERSSQAIIQESLERIYGSKLQLKICDNLHDANNEVIGYNADIILLDIGLPDSPPDNTVSKISDIKDFGAVIVLTGTDSENLMVKSARLGAQDYLLKPIYLKPRNDALFAHALWWANERHQYQKGQVVNAA